VVDAAYFRIVHKLSQTYTTMALPEVAAALGVATDVEAEVLLLRMVRVITCAEWRRSDVLTSASANNLLGRLQVDRGQIDVRIEQIDKTVAFVSAGAPPKVAPAREALHVGVQATHALAESIKALDRRIAISDEYQAKVHSRWTHS